MSGNTSGMNTNMESAESSVINDLRKQNRDLAKRVAEAEQARADAVQSMLTAKGFGKLTSVFLNQVEGFPTDDSVSEFLADLGLDAKESEVPAQEEEDVSEPDAQPLASDLGQQVATAATGDSRPDIMKMLSEAKSGEEIDRIMQEAGLAV